MSKILITGSSGFIGSCLINSLHTIADELFLSDYTGLLDDHYIHPSDLNSSIIQKMDKIKIGRAHV